jgi:hypothetical protein
MTELKRQVARTANGKWRKYVVTLLPGPDPAVEIRERYQRERFTVTLDALYLMLAARGPEHRRALKR